MLNRFVAEVEGVDLRIVFEAFGGLLPDFDERLAVFGFVHGAEMGAVGFCCAGGFPVSPADHLVHIDNDFDIIFFKQRHQDFEMIKRISEPFPVDADIIDIRTTVNDLVTDQIDIPCGKIMNILFGQSDPCRTHYAAPRNILGHAVGILLPEVCRYLHFGDGSDRKCFINQIAEFQFPPSLLNSENNMGTLLIFREITFQRNRLPSFLRAAHDRSAEEIINSLPVIGRKDLCPPEGTACIRRDIFVTNLSPEPYSHSDQFFRGDIQYRAVSGIADVRRRRNDYRKDTFLESHIIFDFSRGTFSKNEILCGQWNFHR